MEIIDGTGMIRTLKSADLRALEDIFAKPVGVSDKGLVYEIPDWLKALGAPATKTSPIKDPPMTTYVFIYLMLIPPKPGMPVYVQRFNDPVSCQVEVINRRETEPKVLYECRPVKGPYDLSKEVK